MHIQPINRDSVVTDAMLVNLPEPVRRYLNFTGVVGTPWINTVHLKYHGDFRLAADRPWMPMKADQVYTTNPPGFQWNARFKMFGLPLLSACDTYKDGQGHMFGKLAGMITVFDARGKELLQGTMLRYLQEMMWFPTAYLSDYVTWEAVDDHAADVTYNFGSESVIGRMFFDDDGRMLNFVASRYREKQGTYSLDTWSTPITEYGVFAGLRLPIRGEAIWQLPEGDLSYIKLHLTGIAYNVPTRTF